MAGDWAKHKTAGDPFAPSAQWYNHVTDAAKALLQGRNHGGAPSPFSLPEGLCLVQNNSGDDCEDFDVLGIDSILFTPEQNLNGFKYDWALKGVTPDVTRHFGKFVITMAPIAQGALGRCFIAGVFPAYVNIQVVGDQFADIDDGETDALISGARGAAQILWADSDGDGTGDQWCIVRVAANLPSGEGVNKVLKIIDANNPGTWGVDFPTFH